MNDSNELLRIIGKENSRQKRIFYLIDRLEVNFNSFYRDGSRARYWFDEADIDVRKNKYTWEEFESALYFGKFDNMPTIQEVKNWIYGHRNNKKMLTSGKPANSIDWIKMIRERAWKNENGFKEKNYD